MSWGHGSQAQRCSRGAESGRHKGHTLPRGCKGGSLPPLPASADTPDGGLWPIPTSLHLRPTWPPLPVSSPPLTLGGRGPWIQAPAGNQGSLPSRSSLNTCKDPTSQQGHISGGQFNHSSCTQGPHGSLTGWGGSWTFSSAFLCGPHSCRLSSFLCVVCADSGPEDPSSHARSDGWRHWEEAGAERPGQRVSPALELDFSAALAPCRMRHTSARETVSRRAGFCSRASLRSC